MTTEAHKDLVLEPATVPFGLGKGAKTQTILTDGTQFYCGDEGCDYQSPNYGSTMAHRSTHGRKAKRDAAEARPGRKPTTLDGRLTGLKMDLLAMAERIEAMEEQVRQEGSGGRAGSNAYQRMYQRARRAEKALADHQRTLAKLAGLS